MKISNRTLARLARHITGDLGITPYRSGPKLVTLFNDFGFDDEYGAGFPSRWMFAEEKLKALNGTHSMIGLIEQVFDPLEFQEKEIPPTPAVEDLNAYLQRDGFELTVSNDGKVRVRARGGRTIEFQPPPSYQPSTQEFVQEHLEKCERKLMDADFPGAITNARSLCEEVLCDIERQFDPEVKHYNGDLPQLYKRVRKLLRMDASDYAEHESVVELLRGLNSIVNGLSGMSNTLADRHGGGTTRGKEHHARLAVNAANTLCTYIVSSLVHQSRPR